MRRALPNILPWLILLGASTSAFLASRVRADIGSGWSWNSPSGHFWIVSAAALLCAVLAVAAGIASIRASNWRVTTIALAFISMAGIFAVHGLATPGFIVSDPSPAARASTLAASPATYEAYGDDYGGGLGGGYGDHGAAATGSAGGTGGAVKAAPGTPPAGRFYNVTGVSSRLAILTSVTLLALAAMRLPAAVEERLTRYRHALLGAGIVAVVGYASAAFLTPWVVPTVIAQSGSAAYLVTGAVAALGLGSAVRFGMSYRLSGIQLHGATAVGAILIVQAQVSLQFGNIWTETFWLYHVQLLAGFAAISWGLLIEYSRGRTTRSLEALTVSDVMAQLRSGFTEPIVALSAALEARDGYTLGHGERVAALAVLIGREMHLNPGRLRAIAAGSLLHDVGKIGVPDAVLHKRGILTTEEYDVIKEHPARGAEMLRHHFDQQTEANVIRHHHERWDGLGYPDGLCGRQIPLEARIAAVADVYDALRSNRAYRPAFSRDEAVPMIIDGAEGHFDPACVEAFLRVVDEWETRYVADALIYAERRAA